MRLYPSSFFMPLSNFVVESTVYKEGQGWRVYPKQLYAAGHAGNGPFPVISEEA